MIENICNKCKKDIKEIYYFGLERIKLCKKCYEKEMKKTEMSPMLKWVKSGFFNSCHGPERWNIKRK